MKRSLSIALLALAGVLLVRRRRREASPASLLGRALRGVRSGDSHAAVNDPALRDLPRFELTSPAFADGAPMPSEYTGAHARFPPLSWTGLPSDAVELALIVEDVDVPFPAPLVHAVALGIDPARGGLPAGAIARPGHPEGADPGLRAGRGTAGAAFLPPTPIPGHGPHRYLFELFAVREPLSFDRPPNKALLVKTLRRLAVAGATLTGTHEHRSSADPVEVAN